MYYGSGTVDRSVSERLAGRCCICRVDAVCAVIKGQHYYVWNDVLAAILKVWLYRKSDSVSQCIFTWRTILPNFIPIRFETTEPWAFSKIIAHRPNKKKKEWQDD